jgi:formylglycine-generating enzyme required for sulfatase activity
LVAKPNKIAIGGRAWLDGAAMSEETAAPPASDSASALAAARRRRLWLRALAVIALIVLGFIGWHYLVELPAERRAAAELAAKRAKNARTIPDLNLDLVWIAPGTFLMGTPEQRPVVRWFYETREKLTKKRNPDDCINDAERPVTWVTLTQPFWLGRTEVTQAQWAAVMGSNPSYFKGDDRPVECVWWDDAMEFCRKLTERERAAGRLPTSYAYTLPTEAQWEYACRAGTTGYYAGDLDAMAWYDKNSGGTTHPVGTKQANGWGLSDMSGNVWEWCLDWYGNYRGGEVTNPRGPTSGSDRVLRGGSWSNDASDVRSALRLYNFPGDRAVGFRLALSAVR